MYYIKSEICIGRCFFKELFSFFLPTNVSVVAKKSLVSYNLTLRVPETHKYWYPNASPNETKRLLFLQTTSSNKSTCKLLYEKKCLKMAFKSMCQVSQ